MKKIIMILLFAATLLNAQYFKVKSPMQNTSENIFRSKLYLGSSFGLYSSLGLSNEPFTYAYIDSATVSSIIAAYMNTALISATNVSTSKIDLTNKFIEMNIMPGVGLSFIGNSYSPFDYGYFDILHANKATIDSFNLSSTYYQFKIDYLKGTTADINTDLNAYQKNIIPKYSNYRDLELLTNSKRGVVMFRIDDSGEEDDKKQELTRIFDKYNFPFVWSFNSGTAMRGSNSAEIARDLTRRGHNVADHTPNHSTEYISFATSGDTARFSGSDGVDSIKYLKGAYYVFLERAFPDTAGYKQNTIVYTTAGTRSITRLSGDALPTSYGYVFIAGEWISPGSQYSLDFASCTKRGVDTNWTFASTDTVDLYYVSTKYVQLTHNGLEALLSETQRQWRDLGLEMPTIWIQPGGLHPAIAADSLDAVGSKYGYVGGESFKDALDPTGWGDDPLWIYKNYWGDITLETADWESQKDDVADRTACGEIMISSGHFYLTSLPGATDADKWDALLARYDSCLAFLSKNKIPVIDYNQFVRLAKARKDKFVNIMPPLNVDIDGSGVPDGYALDGSATLLTSGGAEEWGNYYISSTSTDTLFTIDNLCGIEVGLNKFVVATKGATGDSISVTFTPDAGISTTLTIPANTTDWQYYTGDVIISSSATFTDIRAEVSDYSGGTVGVSYMEFRKK